MRQRVLSTLLPVFCGSLLAAAAATADEPVRTLEQSFVLERGKVGIDLTIGDLVVEGGAGNEVAVAVELFCGETERCRAKAEKIRLGARATGKSLRLRLRRTPRGRLYGLRARMKVTLPRDTRLEIGLRAGDVFVTGVRGDVEVDVVAGDVDIAYGRDDAATVKLDVGAGRADLWLGEGRIQGTGWPRSVTWHGAGERRVEVDVGTGDVTVKLD